MEALWTLQEIADATGGKLSNASAEAKVSSVSIDSRTIQSGALYVAIKGENHDGHSFVPMALEAGAVAALISEPKKNEEAPHILVKDTLQALVKLGQAARARNNGKIIGITGSVGKTSTKEMLKLCFSENGATYATEGNLNNHIGVPLTLSRFPQASDYGIFEMGMNHEGEIAELTQMICPHIAIITEVDAVHLEFFRDVEHIADAKAEIFLGLEEGGVAILPNDNPHFERLVEKVKAQGIDTIVSFGETLGADVQLIDYHQQQNVSTVHVKVKELEYNYKIGATGKHIIKNSLAVIAALYASEVNIDKSLKAFEHFTVLKGRGNRESITKEGIHYTLINDCYNASPASMCAAFESLANLKKEGEASRIKVILGDMLELGEQAEMLHEGLAEAIINAQIDKVYTAGPLMQKLYDVLPADLQGLHADSSTILAEQIFGEVEEGDTFLVKGSRGSKMDNVINALENTQSLETASYA